MIKLYLIVCLSFLIVGCFSNFDPKEDGKLLRSVCNDLPSPPNSLMREKREVMKSHAGVVTMFFSHEYGCENVLNFYDKTLIERKWEKVPKTFFSNPDEIKYKKQEIEINLTCTYGRFNLSCSK